MLWYFFLFWLSWWCVCVLTYTVIYTLYAIALAVWFLLVETPYRWGSWKGWWEYWMSVFNFYVCFMLLRTLPILLLGTSKTRSSCQGSWIGCVWGSAQNRKKRFLILKLFLTLIESVVCHRVTGIYSTNYRKNHLAKELQKLLYKTLRVECAENSRILIVWMVQKLMFSYWFEYFTYVCLMHLLKRDHDNEIYILLKKWTFGTHPTHTRPRSHRPPKAAQKNARGRGPKAPARVGGVFPRKFWISSALRRDFLACEAVIF